MLPRSIVSTERFCVVQLIGCTDKTLRKSKYEVCITLVSSVIIPKVKVQGQTWEKKNLDLQPHLIADIASRHS